jgi:hypothetical protein
MAKKADKQQASALDEVRRHVRIFVDLGRVASESTDEDGFLDQWWCRSTPFPAAGQCDRF